MAIQLLGEVIRDNEAWDFGLPYLQRHLRSYNICVRNFGTDLQERLLEMIYDVMQAIDDLYNRLHDR